jgi:bifunctional non-homologous end joining protein LigD
VSARDGVPPADYEPQLAQLFDEPPEGEQWLHEIKLDGYRIGCRIDRGQVALISRRDHDWTAEFPEVAKGAATLAAKGTLKDALFDGELAAVLPDGRTSFQAMQRGRGGVRPEIAYFVFDLLHLDGADLTGLPLEERKTRLRAVLGERPPHPFRYVDHVIGDGAQVFAQACAMRLEGIVSKDRAAPYRRGARNATWRKVKCLLRQELVVGGYDDSVVGGLGALLLGTYDPAGRLVYVGKVGTGFQRIAAALHAACRKLVQATTPFDDNLPAPRLIAGTHWMKPAMVVEVAFTEWTDGGHIRHPSFQGVRRDKLAREVTRERPAIAVPETATRAPQRSAKEQATKQAKEQATKQAKEQATKQAKKRAKKRE